MGIVYEDTEDHVLTEAQESSFVSFVSGIWPGTPGNIQGASLRRRNLDEGGYQVHFAVRGIIVATTPAELPTPPFTLTQSPENYRYEHIEEVILTGPQISAFASFLGLTWTGAVGDVNKVSFTRVPDSSGAPGIDINAAITGTKEAAALADLPPPPVRIVAIT